MKTFSTLVISALIGAIAGSLVTFYLTKNQGPTSKPTTNELIQEFYLTENAVHVSPHTIRKKMDKNESNFVLVDLRSSEEYEKEHIVTAINIPTYKDPNNSISIDTEKEEKERIIKSFRDLGTEKEIIVYCYSMPCMTGRKVGKMLSENGIYVKLLNIGWNEWRYYWNLWNHDSETPSDYKDYVVSGKDPGEAKLKDVFSPCKEGELGC